MNRNLDPHLQRIIDNAVNSNGQDRPEQAFNFPLMDAQRADHSFQSRLRQPTQEPMLLDDLGRFPLLIYSWRYV